MFRKYSNVILIYENINLLQGFTGGPVVKKSTWQAGDVGVFPVFGKIL